MIMIFKWFKKDLDLKLLKNQHFFSYSYNKTSKKYVPKIFQNLKM